jgi:hypothetical protein
MGRQRNDIDNTGSENHRAYIAIFDCP